MTTETISTPISGAEARRVARNAGAIAVARILSSAVLFGWQLVLGPWLGVTEYGVYGTVGALFAIGVPIASFSMGTIVIRDVARDPSRAGRYLTATLFSQTLLAMLAYVGINLAAVGFGYEQQIRAFVAVAGLSLFIDLLGNLCYDQLIAHERMVATSAVDITHILVRIGLAGLALVAGYGLMGVYIATIITGAIRSAVLAWMLRRAGVRPTFPLDRHIAGLLLINSAPLALSGFLSLAYQHADKLMTTKLIGPQGTGYLNAAFVIIYGVVELLSTTILIATYPLMSRAHADGQRSDLFGFIVQKLSFFSLVVSLPLALTLSVFAAEITLPLFGARFGPTADVLRVLIWYAVVTMINNVFAQALTVQNRQRRLLLIRGFGLGLNVALLLAFVPVIGTRGAAFASVCAEIVVLLLMLSSFHAPGFSLRAQLPRLARLAAVGLIAAAVMLLLGRLHPILGIVGGLAIYVTGGLGARILSPDDWDLLYRLVSAMPGGALIRRYWRRDVELNW